MRLNSIDDVMKMLNKYYYHYLVLVRQLVIILLFRRLNDNVSIYFHFQILGNSGNQILTRY